MPVTTDWVAVEASDLRTRATMLPFGNLTKIGRLASVFPNEVPAVVVLVTMAPVA